MRLLLLFFLSLTMLLPQTPQTAPPETDYLLKPARVWDGESDQLHDNWVVLVHGDKIVKVGPANDVTPPAGAKTIDLPGLTLMPGLIEAHSHILLHPYSETPWNDQVARESLSLRVARATNHLRNTLQAGFTTIRDLGTEGAGYADVGIKQAVEQGIIPGPRITAHTSNRILYQDGAPIASFESGETHFLVELSRAMEWKAKAALMRKATRPELRSYLQRPA